MFWGVRQELVTGTAPAVLPVQQQEQYQWKNSSQGLCRMETMGCELVSELQVSQPDKWCTTALQHPPPAH